MNALILLFIKIYLSNNQFKCLLFIKLNSILLCSLSWHLKCVHLLVQKRVINLCFRDMFCDIYAIYFVSVYLSITPAASYWATLLIDHQSIAKLSGKQTRHSSWDLQVSVCTIYFIVTQNYNWRAIKLPTQYTIPKPPLNAVCNCFDVLNLNLNVNRILFSEF